MSSNAKLTENAGPVQKLDPDAAWKQVPGFQYHSTEKWTFPPDHFALTIGAMMLAGEQLPTLEGAES